MAIGRSFKVDPSLFDLIYLYNTTLMVFVGILCTTFFQEVPYPERNKLTMDKFFFGLTVNLISNMSVTLETLWLSNALIFCRKNNLDFD